MPLQALVAGLLWLRASSKQSRLDAFFGLVANTVDLVRGVSDRAIAQASSHLHLTALVGVNDELLADVAAGAMLSRLPILR